jgi:hypothetical protein
MNGEVGQEVEQLPLKWIETFTGTCCYAIDARSLYFRVVDLNTECHKDSNAVDSDAPTS